MIRADLADAAQRLPELVRLAREGEEVMLTFDGKTVCEIVPLDHFRFRDATSFEMIADYEEEGANPNGDRIFTREELIAAGITPAKSPNREPLPPPVDEGPSLLGILLEDRENARG